MHVAITHLVDLCVRRNTFDVSDFSAFIFNVELHVLVLWAFSVSLMLHRLVWWRVLQFDLLWQSETRCRPKQLKHSCLVWLFSYTDASFHILDHHLKSAYQYKMQNICEVSLEWSLGHILDFIIGFWLGVVFCIEFYILFICSLNKLFLSYPSIQLVEPCPLATFLVILFIITGTRRDQ